MSTYTLHREQYLPISITEAWHFFSSAKNLSKITPEEMSFVITSALTDEPVHAGQKIEYIVKPLFGIPLRWVTEITHVDEPQSFTDIQLKGPYALWQHTHTFAAVPGGVKMTDNVKYALPLGFLGTIAHTLLVKKKLEDIFSFRKVKLEQLFGKFK